MAVYKYKALNSDGRTVKGEVNANNEIELEERLKENDLDLIDCREQKQRRASAFSSIKLDDLILFCIQMEQLDKAGVPMLDALGDARDASESAKLRDILSDVHESVKGGDILSAAMKKHPKTFNDVFVGLIAAGEKTGNLSMAFGHLNHHMRWVAEIKRKVRKAMAYPIMLLIVISLVVTVLMVYVVPKLTDFMMSQGFDLPLHTRILIATSDFMGHYWYVVFSTPIISIILISILYKTSDAFAYHFDGFAIKIPVIGTTMRKIDMARFTHFFGVMFKSGIDIIECLGGAERVVGNRVLKRCIQMVQQTVSGGSSITNALRQTGEFPNLVVRMFKVGEESGNMDDALENVNYFYDREVNDAVDRLIGMIQPAMTVILGLIVLWVVASVFGPLYETFGNMNF